MKPLIFALWVVFACGSLSAQTNVWQPSPGHTQVPIWPGAVPDAQPVPGPEYVTNVTPTAGMPWIAVCNVSQPTMTVYSPKGTNTGVAVVVFPGGGYNCLAIDLEGTEICDWLTSRGHHRCAVEIPRADSREWGRMRSHRWRWKMRRGRWGWCAFTPPSGILIRTRLE